MSDTCRSCHAPMTWAVLAATGKAVPLDHEILDPSSESHVYALVPGAHGDRAYAYKWNDLAEKLALKQAVSVARAREIVAETYPFHRSHFRTCPDADRFSRNQRKTGATR
jgi:hypothetical protein